MLAAERRRFILNALKKNGSFVIREMSSQCEVSEETIRRDLEKLCSQNKAIIREHGGAYIRNTGDEDAPYEFRRSIVIEEKQIIAKLCVERIRPFQAIILDCSTTALAIAQMIDGKSFQGTVITNSERITQHLSNDENITLVCIGGILRYSNKSYVGYQATESIKWYHADQAFVSCSGLHKEFGITSYNEEEARVRNGFFAQANEKYLIADHTKFDRCAVNKVSNLQDITAVITDELPSKDWLDYFKANKIECITPNSNKSYAEKVCY